MMMMMGLVGGLLNPTMNGDSHVLVPRKHLHQTRRIHVDIGAKSPWPMPQRAPLPRRDRQAHVSVSSAMDSALGAWLALGDPKTRVLV